MQKHIDIPEPRGGLTFEEFFAFVQTRPDDERWELFDGEKVLQASPTDRHQLIVTNFITLLTSIAWSSSVPWMALPGLGVHDKGNPNSAPLPDILVLPSVVTGRHYRSDPIVTFEVMSPKTKRRDLEWKLDYYTGLSTMQHYVVIAQDEPLVRHFARADGWKQRKLRKAAATLNLEGIGVKLRLGDIYRGTGVFESH